MTYDSRPDTIAHALRVRELLTPVIVELDDRSREHDASKTEPPEKEMFDEFTPRLKESTYGSDEYKGFLKEMGPALQHHYEVNRHHPEHFAEGINEMTLIDLMEMLADWKAASERHDDGDLMRSIKINKERFHISGQLQWILFNTASHLGWLK